MGLEAATFADSLDVNNPTGADARSQGDDHLRLLKTVIKNTWPGMAGRSKRVQSKAGNYTAVLTDNDSLLVFTAEATLTMPSGSSLGNGFSVCAIASGGDVLVSPTTGTVNSGASVTIPIGSAAVIFSDGANFAALFSGQGSLWSTGDIKVTFKTTADPSWVMMNDGTIGNASSGATSRANGDAKALFILLWNGTTNANCAVSSGRGANALADWNSGKTIALPKTLGRELAIAGAGSGLTSRALAQVLGTETHPLTVGETPVKSHAHGLNWNDPGHEHGAVQSFGTGGPHAGIVVTGGGIFQSDDDPGFINHASTGISASVAAASDATASGHNNISPRFHANVMIKL